MMNEERFWSLIAGAWSTTEQAVRIQQMAFTGELEASDDLNRVQKQMLTAITSAFHLLDADELRTFDRILERKLYDLDRADLHAYTDGSDDGFLYCRGFIVSMGQAYYDLVRADPSCALMDVEFEGVCYHSYAMYTQTYGPLPPSELSRETGSYRAGWVA